MTFSKSKSNRRATPKPPEVKAKSKFGPVTFDQVELIKVSGSKDKGGGVGGEAWLILVDGKRAGSAYINMSEDPLRGIHPSFHIFLNRPSQGRHIGRIAYERCCFLSKYDVIFAHMRKSNISSRRAAEHAGFIEATENMDTQLVMVWYRPN